MITFQHFAFAAPPRTGSTWFLQAATIMGFEGATKTNLHIPFPDDWRGFSLSLVRHPADWLVSYFESLQGGKIGVPAVDALANHYKLNDVRSSIRSFLETEPDKLTQVFDAYRADTVLKMEDYPWNAIEFFQSIGCKNALDLRGLDKQNGRKHKTTIPRSLLGAILEHEPELSERYEYFW